MAGDGEADDSQQVGTIIAAVRVSFPCGATAVEMKLSSTTTSKGWFECTHVCAPL